jgi:hypothetical protein
MWDDFELVTLAQGKAHLRLGSSTDQDADLELKLAQAHALVLDYIARPTDETWTATMDAWQGSPSTAPRAVQAAILRQFGDLVRFRGDDDDPSEARVDGTDLSPRVKQLLRFYRQPVLA